MNRILYNKIVRDKIPDIIAVAGKKAIIEVVGTDEVIVGLEDKLSEELKEYLADHKLEELADILEVIRGILYHRGTTWDDLETIRLLKYDKNGGFEKGIRLLEVEEP